MLRLRSVFLLFHKGATDQTDASRGHKTACPPLPSEQELTFPDLDDAPKDVTDFPDDLDEDDSVSQEELSSVWEEINKLTPLGSVITWPSKPNKKVPVKREPRLCKGLVQIYIPYQFRCLRLSHENCPMRTPKSLDTTLIIQHCLGLT